MNSTEKWDAWLNKRLNKMPVVPTNQKATKAILFLMHDVALAGAQLFLVRLLEWIKQNQPLPVEITIGISRDKISVYGDGGKFILDRLAKCGLVYFIDPNTKLPENVDAIRAGNYSLIYVNTCTLGGLLNSIGKIPTPIIAHVHELSFWIQYKLGIENFNLLLKYHPQWIACSNAVKTNLVNLCHVPSANIEIIHSFIPFVDDLGKQPNLRQQIRKELNLSENTFVLASCGTIDWRKGGDLLIPLVISLKKKLPHHNFVCVWIGSVTTEIENEMRYVIEQAGIQQNILLLGSKTNALDYMSAADAFLLLSREDPFPLVMLEAGACRLPVIAFDGSGGASEFVETDAGMLVPYLDLEAMAQKIVQLFENPELRKSMGDRAYGKVKNLYNENVLAPKIVDLINRHQQHEIIPVHQPIHKFKVSVIVPNYNHAPYLKQRLDSIYQQTYSNFEVILLDDASSDGSQEILNSYATMMPNTVLVENNTNSGSAFHQWQKGLSLAQGEYIWVAESDDFAAPTFLESLVQMMDKNPNVGLAYTQSNLVDSQGSILGKATGWTEDLDSERWSQPFINHGQDEIRKFLIQKNTIPNASAVLLRKKVLLECGLVDTSFRLCGDWLQWIKVLSQSDIAFVPECLNFWRQNTSNARVASAGTLEWIEGEKVLNYAGEILHLSAAEKDNIVLKFLRRCWQWQKEFIEQTTGHSIAEETIYYVPLNNKRGKCKLSVCAIMKDEAPYLIEWLEFHKIVGVERFYLYNNNSTDNTVDILQPYLQSGEVILHDWPITPGQRSAYEHCLSTYKHESEWMAFIDIDEFLFPTEKDNIKEVLEEFCDFPGVAVNWLVFGSSGHSTRQEGLQVENFPSRSEENFGANKIVKTIVRPEFAICSGNPHYFLYRNDRVAVTENKEPIVEPWSTINSVQKLRINHYFTRSLQESKEKMLRGRADILGPRQWRFEEHDRNEVEDLTIQRFIPRLRQAVNAVISQSRIAQILVKQWHLEAKLCQIQMELEVSKTKLRRIELIQEELEF